MRLHAIQHVEFEGPALIAEWASSRGHEITTSLASSGQFPATDDVDFLVVLGGPMDADDELASPWLHAEKRYVAEGIASGRPVLGVCLGAQIIAEVLGGEVRRNAEREIGWFEVARTEFAADEPLVAEWPERAVVGHWHGDTFALAAGMRPVLSSEACANQAFVFDRRVVGLQFHIEWTEASLARLVENCANEIAAGGRWVMTAEQMLSEARGHIAENRGLLFSLLDGLAESGGADAGAWTP